MPEIELSAGTIEYVDTGGDGPVVVPVHGVVMDGTVWNEVVANLRADHRCVIPTLPLGAHRRAMNSDADLSLAGQARLLGELIERLDLRDVTLVANDWGGPQVTALDDPDRVVRLVLTPCEAFDNLPPGLPGKFALLAGKLPGGLFLAAQSLRIRALRRLPFTFGWMMATRPIPRQLVDSWIVPLRTQRGVRRDLAKLARTTDTNALVEAAHRLEGYDRPVLVIWSVDDKVMPREHGRRLAELVVNGTLVEVDDSAVLMPIDQPAELAKHIRRFIAEHRTRAVADPTAGGAAGRR
jgi:pimeloyl-ACP methyl ester carboxylesterase